MSYAPNIIFDKRDLEKHATKIEQMHWDYERMEVSGSKQVNRVLAKKELHQRCIQRLYGHLHNGEEQIKFRGVEFTIMEIDGSTSNKIMRGILDDLKIEYTLYGG